MVKRLQEILLIAIVIMIIIVIVDSSDSGWNFSLEKLDKEGENIIEETEVIKVYIFGEVVYPGVYELEKDSNLGILLELAGGLKDDSDKKLNLDTLLTDGQQVFIEKSSKVTGESQDELSKSSFGEDIIFKNEVEFLNRASKENLIEIKYIGNVTADRIIEYREISPFDNLSELMNLEGIGPKKYKIICDDIKSVIGGKP